METQKKDININAQTEENVEQTTTVKKPSPKETVMEDGKLSFLEILFVARYFLPILTTIGWLLAWLLGHISFFEYFSIVLIGIGIIAAITVSPLKFIKFIFTSAAKGFQILRGFIPFYGVADLVAAIFGTTFGFMFGVAVVFGLPAVFTIPKFFQEGE